MTLLNRLPPCGIGLLLALLGSSSLLAQGTTTSAIRGHVTDSASSRPLQGVTVTVGTRTVVTTADGLYSITGLTPGEGALIARMIGYTPITRTFSAVEGETVELDLVMAAQALNLSEMVVVGYGEQRAADITGAVSNVTAEEFNTGRIVTPTELIQNKVAGVQVVENNEPGGSTTIRIRGTTSVNASSEPLVVIDGMPIGTGSGGGVSTGRDPLNFINSNDIESITVLRDASAASIYGANAANGVILITTKRGKAGQAPRFEYSGSVSASSVTRLPSMLNAAQFRTAVTEHADADNLAQLRDANTNWFNLVDRTGYGQEQNFALSGAGSNSSYRLSANYLDQNGIMEGTNIKRVTLGLNYNQSLLQDQLNIKTNLRGSRQADEFTPGGVLSNAAQMGPTQPVHDSTTVTGFYDWPASSTVQAADNPVAILALARDEATTYRGVGNIQAEYKLPFLAGLSANGSLGFDVTKGDRVTFTDGRLHSETKNGHFGNYFRSNPSQLNTVLESYLNYAVPRAVGPGLLDLTGGYSYSNSHGEFPTVQAESLSTNLLGTNGIPAAKTVTPLLNVQDAKLISLFGRVNYNIDDRYLAAFSVRRDGSSRFGENNQWGTFPSLAVAWRVSEESFLKGKMGLSDLKLRGSWARTGNQSFGNYLYASTYTVSDAQSQYYMGDDGFVSTIRPSAVDPNIKWEATRSFDLGIDFGFQNQRFSGAIDWYDKKTTDLIFSVPAAAGTVPGDFVTTNIGSMRNRGIELSLSAQILRGGASNSGLRWTTDFTAAHNTNELLSITPFASGGTQILTGGIAGGVGSTIQVLTPGKPVNSFFVYKQKYDDNGKPIENEYEDLNNDGQINQDDLRAFHDPAPKWILGHSSYLNYGKFDFGFTVRAYFGNYVYNNVASNLGTYAEVTRGSPYNLHSSVLETGFENPQYFSDYYVENASFLRMDNITLGYSFDLTGQSARVYGTLQNAFTISGYSGVDPTAGLNGIDNNLYPRSRTFSAGLSLRF